MEPMYNILTKKELSKGYNILYDLEYALQYASNDKDLIHRLHKKFYKHIPHTEEKQFTLFSLYVKKAMIIGHLKDLSWTQVN
jgi:hypothetical protein